MPSSRRKLAMLAASLLIPMLGACASQPTVTEARKIAEAIGHVRPSRRDTCDTQQQIAAQSSRIDTIVTGKETVYKPDCSTRVEPPKKTS